MANPNPKQGVDPVTLALAGVLGISIWCAVRVQLAAQAIIDAAQDKNTYSLFVTDEGLKADNQVVADQVNQSQAALLDAKAEAQVLIVVCAFLAVALTWRCLGASRGQLASFAKAGLGRILGR